MQIHVTYARLLSWMSPKRTGKTFQNAEYLNILFPVFYLPFRGLRSLT